MRPVLVTLLKPELKLALVETNAITRFNLLPLDYPYRVHNGLKGGHTCTVDYDVHSAFSLENLGKKLQHL